MSATPTIPSSFEALVRAVLLDHQPVSPDAWVAVRTSWLERVKDLAEAAFPLLSVSAPRPAGGDDAGDARG